MANTKTNSETLRTQLAKMDPEQFTELRDSYYQIADGIQGFLEVETTGQPELDAVVGLLKQHMEALSDRMVVLGRVI